MATVWIFRRDSELGTLPKLCLKCGKPSTLLVEKDFFGTLLWGAPMTFLLAAFTGWETAKARVPMCVRHRHHWRNRRLFLLPTFLVGAAIMGVCLVGSFVLGEFGSRLIFDGRLPLINLFGAVLLIVSVAFGFSGIQAKEVHDRGIQLAGVSEAFARAYEAQVGAACRDGVAKT